MAVLAGAVVATGGYFWSLKSAIKDNTTYVSNALTHDSADDTNTHQAPENILLLGSDKRAEDSHITGQRADVIMLAHIDKSHRHAYVVSFPRDLWVDVPGHGRAKLNAAMSYGGLPLAVKTVENLVDAPIEHVAKIDFDGFGKVIDMLGGVTVDVPKSFKTDDFTFQAGKQTMSGDEALSFVRERHAFSDGGFQRMRDHQAFLHGVMRALLTSDTLSSPGKVSDLVTTIAPYLTVDKQFTPKAMTSLGWSLRKIRMDNVEFMTAPHGSTGRTSSGASIVKFDADGMSKLATALHKDSLASYYSMTESGQPHLGTSSDQ